MDVSGEVADLMVKESIQITEETVKLLAAGSKNLTAFLMALAQDNKKLSGRTNMARLLRDGKELKVFHIKESDLADFRTFGKKNVLYAVIKDSRAENGMVDLITNVDYVSQVNHFMESRGYAAPVRVKGDETPKKAAPRAQQENSLAGRGSGLTPSQSRTTRTMTSTPTSEKPSVKARLDMLRAASEGMRQPGQSPQHKRTPPKTR
ncbi:MAG: PcfB family protein [Lawsonibacter sp.]|jgi:hypothetical protein|nr:PcfB family protein [Lawsonibacter sp.]